MLFRIMEFVCKSFRNAELSLAALAAKNVGWLVGVCARARVENCERWSETLDEQAAGRE